MMRHREQDDPRRPPDGFKPNYLENVSTGDACTFRHTCSVTLYEYCHKYFQKHTIKSQTEQKRAVCLI